MTTATEKVSASRSKSASSNSSRRFTAMPKQGLTGAVIQALRALKKKQDAGH
jgi:hypothetical protein